MFVEGSAHLPKEMKRMSFKTPFKTLKFPSTEDTRNTKLINSFDSKERTLLAPTNITSSINESNSASFDAVNFSKADSFRTKFAAPLIRPSTPRVMAVPLATSTPAKKTSEGSGMRYTLKANTMAIQTTTRGRRGRIDGLEDIRHESILQDCIINQNKVSTSTTIFNLEDISTNKQNCSRKFDTESETSAYSSASEDENPYFDRKKLCLNQNKQLLIHNNNNCFTEAMASMSRVNILKQDNAKVCEVFKKPSGFPKKKKRVKNETVLKKPIPSDSKLKPRKKSIIPVCFDDKTSEQEKYLTASEVLGRDIDKTVRMC